nr:GNAT family N-acetyltransferase [Sphingomonas sp. ID1715]
MTGQRPLASGYRLEISREARVHLCQLLAGDGSCAAIARGVEANGAFIFDRVRTEPAHQRRGLGRAMMHALAALRRDERSRFVLAATEAGRGLYEQIGWRVVSPYLTARFTG